MSGITVKRAAGSWTLAAIVLLGLGGCSNDMDDLRSYMEDVKTRPGGRIEPLPKIKEYDSYVYSAEFMRSPFTRDLPQVAGPISDGIQPDQARNREFLEQFPMDTLRMVGTLELGPETYGLVQTNDGLIHRVQTGNFIGQNDGEIKEITQSEIKLVEIVTDGIGGYLERDAAVSIND